MKIWARYQLSIKDTNYPFNLLNQSKRPLLLVNKAVYVMTYPVLRKAYSYTYTFYLYVQRTLTYTNIDEREKAPKNVES